MEATIVALQKAQKEKISGKNRCRISKDEMQSLAALVTRIRSLAGQVTLADLLVRKGDTESRRLPEQSSGMSSFLKWTSIKPHFSTPHPSCLSCSSAAYDVIIFTG